MKLARNATEVPMPANRAPGRRRVWRRSFLRAINVRVASGNPGGWRVTAGYSRSGLTRAFACFSWSEAYRRVALGAGGPELKSRQPDQEKVLNKGFRSPDSSLGTSSCNKGAMQRSHTWSTCTRFRICDTISTSQSRTLGRMKRGGTAGEAIAPRPAHRAADDLRAVVGSGER